MKKEAMGFGDVKFVGMIGAFCGWQGAVCSIFGGALVGTVWFTFALIGQKIFSKKGKEVVTAVKSEGAADQSQESTTLGFGVQVPFGPMLAIGAAIYFLVADRWIAAYFAELNALL